MVIKASDLLKYTRNIFQSIPQWIILDSIPDLKIYEGFGFCPRQKSTKALDSVQTNKYTEDLDSVPDLTKPLGSVQHDVVSVRRKETK